MDSSNMDASNQKENVPMEIVAEVEIMKLMAVTNQVGKNKFSNLLDRASANASLHPTTLARKASSDLFLQSASSTSVQISARDHFLARLWNPAITEEHHDSVTDPGTMDIRGEFEVFPKLPAELRLKIWKEAMPGPRVMEVCYTADRESFQGERIDYENHGGMTAQYADHMQNDANYKFGTHCPPPTLLAVCQESRAETLTVYSARLETAGKKSNVMFHPINDTISFPFYCKGDDEDAKRLNSRSFSERSRNSIQHMAFDSLNWFSSLFDDPIGLADFPALTDVTFVGHHEDCCEGFPDRWVNVMFIDCPPYVSSNANWPKQSIKMADEFKIRHPDHTALQFFLKTPVCDGVPCCFQAWEFVEESKSRSELDG